MITISASEFKARCLALLDRVSETGESLVILKRGKPVARLVPASVEVEFPQHGLEGTVEVRGDILSPALPEAEWEALGGEP